ncbi:putative copper chaperone CsoZ [Staphylococcus haemolyticus]|uniref:putative copper chaperone CsoZ n=1 Tax=Staphylococcus haemolyticus TaxID=1283 RepID=UPI001F0B3870|nr:heavy-metal-associated domain-containing protein [Staphylococcus haemolyticus]MCH4477278.1 heavy-metal-associated domain-containing protein [Staphylococcus haemolyticus]MEB2657078.1 heavy-metal-associated domain-containing protein [Staphylococcus haemolyticus]
MNFSEIRISELNTEEQANSLQHRLEKMIGVDEVIVKLNDPLVKISYETPTNLNSIEKEIYDDGYKVLG